MEISGCGSVQQYDYQKISNEKKVNSTSKNTFASSIAEEIKTKENGDISTKNSGSMYDMLETAESALSEIHESLQRIRELSVHSSNGLYEDEDLPIIQTEIDELKTSISDVIEQTQYNGTNLLDGSMGEVSLGSNPNGEGKKFTFPELSLESLGIADFDVTGEFDVSNIDDAIEMVADSRRSLGDAMDSLQKKGSNNQYEAFQLTSAQSRIEGFDYANNNSELTKNQGIDQYKKMMQVYNMS